MKMLGSKAGAERLLEHGNYTVSQLVSTPDVPDATKEEFARANDALKTRIQEYAGARLSSLLALGVRDRKSEALGFAIRSLAVAVRLKALRRFGSPLYKSYFPEGVREVTTGSVPKQIEAVKTVLTRLELESDESLKSHTAPIETTLREFEEAARLHADAMAAEAGAWNRLQAEKSFWSDAYRKTYNVLKAHYHRMPRRADGFFRRIHRSRGGEKPQEPSTPAAPAIPTAQDEAVVASESVTDDGVDAV